MKRPAIACTRALGENEELIRALDRLGCDGVEYPASRYEALCERETLHRALAALDRGSWLILTSARSIEYLGDALAQVSPQVKIASVGPATSAAIRATGCEVAFEAQEFVGEALAYALVANFPPAHALMPRSALGGRESVDILKGAKWDIHDLHLYTARPDTQGIHELGRSLAASELQGIAFASPSAFLNVLSLIPAEAKAVLSSTKLFSIGPATTSTIHEAGYTVAAQADPHTLGSLAECIAQCFNARP